MNIEEQYNSIIVKKVKRQKRRILIYGDKDDFTIIASPDEQVYAGDIIAYEPGNEYIGFFVKVIPKGGNIL